MNGTKVNREERTSTNFSVRLPHDELKMIDAIAEKSGVSRNTLIRLGLRQLTGVKFLDARELKQLTEEMESLICGLNACSRAEAQIGRSQIEQIQDSLIENQRRMGCILMDFEKYIAALLAKID